MRILHVSHQYAPAIGGAEQYITQLSEELAGRGHDVTVFTSRTADYRTWANVLPPAEMRHRVQVERFRALPRRGSNWRALDIGLSNYANGPAWLWEPLIWYGNGPVMPGLWRALRSRRRDFDLVHISQLHYAHAWPAFRAARQASLPIVLTPHLHAEQPETYDVGYMRTMLRSADAVLAVTPAEKAFLLRNRLATRVSVGGNSLDLADYPALDQSTARARFDIPEDAFVVLFLGRKVAYKGLAQVVGAFKQLREANPNLYLLAVGRETEDSQRIWAAAGDLPGVTIRDAVSDEDRLAALAACDVLAVPSTGEAFGIVYLEAWAYGKPVIAARIESVASLIDDGIDGFLVDPASHQELAARMLALAEDPAQGRAMGARGRQKLAQRYTTVRMGDIVEALYRRVLRHAIALPPSIYPPAS
jgi:glycosyltransferase involved in cell wall biosynthesis